jgi:Family of unknown function (DUF6459)
MTPPPPSSAGGPRSRPASDAGGVVLPLVPSLQRSPARRRPLPDAAALRLLLVPDSAPPYDERPAAADRDTRLRAAGPVQDSPAEDSPAAPPRPAAPWPQPAARSQPGAPPSRTNARPRPAAPLPETGARSQPGAPSRMGARPQPGTPSRTAPAAWPSHFAQVLAETLAGSRPPAQITPWTTDRARRLIRQLGPMLAAGPAPRVRRIVTSRPSAGVVEMTVIVGCGAAVRALAVRLEHEAPHDRSPGRAARAARWVCTAIEAA